MAPCLHDGLCPRCVCVHASVSVRVREEGGDYIMSGRRRCVNCSGPGAEKGLARTGTKSVPCNARKEWMRPNAFKRQPLLLIANQPGPIRTHREREVKRVCACVCACVWAVPY
jgi:hypothetical protein